MDEGYIKFTCHLEYSAPPDPDVFPGLTLLRRDLHDAGLVGVYANGIGFGNVSARVGRGSQFIITGSGTGAMRVLPGEYWSIVTGCSADRNSLSCRGRIEASSESLTHDAVFRANPSVRFVVHAHSSSLFREQLKRGAVATPPSVAFGTPEMAEAIYKQVYGRDGNEGFLVMAGHDEGVIVYGETIRAIRRILKNRLRTIGIPLSLD